MPHRDPQPTDIDEKILAFRRRTAGSVLYSSFLSVPPAYSAIPALLAPRTSQNAIGNVSRPPSCLLLPLLLV